MGFSRQVYWSGPPCPPPGDLPNPGIEARSPTLQVDSLPSEPPGKPKNTGVGSLSFLQGIFLTQESSKCLLHCRWILYLLGYQGNPYIVSTNLILLNYRIQHNFIILRLGNGNPLQYSCPGNSVEGGAWQATVCGFAKSQI